LLGLSQRDKRTFLVIPGGFLLWALVGLMAANVFVFDSRAESQSIDGIFVGLLMAVVYVMAYLTIYPVIERRLPAHLRTEERDPAWKDLLIPGVLSVISIVIGVLMIR
jgi:hypothetical protein